MSILDEMESDIQSDIKVDDLTNISQLSRKLTHMDEEIERLEAELKHWKDDRRKLSEDTLPNGIALPLETFNVYIGQKIKVTK